MINFGGLSDHCDFASSRFVILPITYDRTASYGSGARRGPLSIIEASTHMELWDEELEINPYQLGIHTRPQLETVSLDPQIMVEAIRAEVQPLAEAGKIPVVLGGEHSVALGAIMALRAVYPDLIVVQFDAHADLRNEFEGSAYSHACVMRRVFDLGIPFFQIGIRSLSEEEAGFIKEHRLSPFFMHRFPPAEAIMTEIIRHRGRPLYITFDVDALNPAIMPATGTPEPGGLEYGDCLRILRSLFSNFAVKGFDLVELAPIPGLVAPEFLAARLIYKMMAYVAQRSK